MKEIVFAAALGLLVAGQQGTGTLGAPAAAQQPQAAAQQQAAQQQAGQIPDAPRPQTTGLTAVTPGKGATDSSSTSGTPAGATDNDGFQNAPGTQAPQAPAKDEVQDEAPVTPANTQEFINDPSQYTQRIRVNAVEVPFIVKDSKGKLVPGLTWRDVHVYENNVRQKITVFTVDPHPLSVALVIDQSMPTDVMTRVNNALGALQGAFTPYDEVAVFTYNNGPRMVTDFTGGQSPRLVAAIERSKNAGRDTMYYAPGEALEQGINLNNGAESHENPLASGGPGSPQGLSHDQVPREVHTLNDAIMMAAQATTKAGPGRERIVYVISDGKEYGSKAKSKDVIRYLQTNKVQVDATLVGDSSVAGMGFVESIHLPLMMRDNILPVFTKASGGEFYADYRTKGIEASFAKITEDARTQYTVWYNSHEPITDGKFRKTEVRVLRPNLQVVAKEGYYPTPANYGATPAPPLAPQ